MISSSARLLARSMGERQRDSRVKDPFSSAFGVGPRTAAPCAFPEQFCSSSRPPRCSVTKVDMIRALGVFLESLDPASTNR